MHGSNESLQTEGNDPVGFHGGPANPPTTLARPRPITDPDPISGGPVNLSTESGKIPEISPAQIATSATSDEKLVALSTGFQCESRLLESAISSSVCELMIS